MSEISIILVTLASFVCNKSLRFPRAETRHDVAAF